MLLALCARLAGPTGDSGRELDELPVEVSDDGVALLC